MKTIQKFGMQTAFVMITCFSLLIACSRSEKEVIDPDFVIARNAVTKVDGKDGVTITASDVFSRRSSFRREIEIQTKEAGNLGKVYLTFTSADADNIYEKMRNSPNTVNGELTIETGGQVILRKKVVNGAWARTDVVAYKVDTNGSEEKRVNLAACSVTTVHDCVAWEIDDMNWVEYGFCLAGAPACYAGLWASCTWEVCHNNKTYVNPN